MRVLRLGRRFDVNGGVDHPWAGPCRTGSNPQSPVHPHKLPYHAPFPFHYCPINNSLVWSMEDKWNYLTIALEKICRFKFLRLLPWSLVWDLSVPSCLYLGPKIRGLHLMGAVKHEVMESWVLSLTHYLPLRQAIVS